MLYFFQSSVFLNLRKFKSFVNNSRYLDKSLYFNSKITFILVRNKQPE